MKKIFVALLIVFLGVFLVSCENDEVPLPSNLIKAMDTNFGIFIYYDESDKEVHNQVQTLLAKITDELNYLHNLTNNFERGDNTINNVYYINENPGLKILIDEDLYDILNLSLQYQDEFLGYFNVSIGLIIDQWKEIIFRDIDIEGDYTDEEFALIMDNIDAIPIIEDGILLEKVNDEHYVTITEGVKIDLGAIAKGYAVDKIKDMIVEAGFTNYKVEGGQSSLEFGENPNREGGNFKVGIRDPNKLVGYKEIIDIKNAAIVTSGDLAQYYYRNDYKYHHIISPATKRPENYRNLVTVVGDSSTKLDALTTALMAMPDDVYNDFIKNYPQYTFYSFVVK